MNDLFDISLRAGGAISDLESGEPGSALPAIRAAYAPSRRAICRLVYCEIEADQFVPIELDRRLPRKITTEHVRKCLDEAGLGSPKYVSLEWLAYELEMLRRQVEVACAVIVELDNWRKDRERILADRAALRRDLARAIERGERAVRHESYFVAGLRATLAALDEVPAPPAVPRPEMPWH